MSNEAALKNYKLLIVLLSLIVSACSNKPAYDPAPEGVSLSGIWVFDRQDEESYEYLINRLNYIHLGSHNSNQPSHNSSPELMEQKMLKDLLVGLLTITPKELYIEQSDKQIAIDFGVAGYHTFNIAKKTEILMQGLEIDAYAGWQGNDFLIRLGQGISSQLIEKFTLINNEQLVETIELKLSNGNNSLKHKRYFRKAESSKAE